MSSTTDPSLLDVVVVGGSQAGLAVGYHLAQRGLSFVVLDAGPEVGHAWRSRWDSLRLFTPAQYSGLPGMAFPSRSDTYPSKDDVAAYLQAYASAFDLPVRHDSGVTGLRKGDEGYIVTTVDDVLAASQVVVATGPFQVPFIPAIAGGADETVAQIHSAEYWNPSQLPTGRVLVVGGGNSGFQIAEELAATRKVDLAVGKRMPSLPQRFLGKDLFWWLTGIGFMKVSTDSRPGQRLSQRDVLIGSSARKLRRAGATIRGRLANVIGRRALFDDGSDLEVDAIVWSTGYRPDYAWIDIPEIKDEGGHIGHRRGETDAPGLFFVGLSWQHTRGSALIGFVKDDAAFIASRIDSHRQQIASDSSAPGGG